MAQISKMSGTSWHVEEHYKTRVHTRNCVDCKYFQTEGRMCKKKNEHVSFNFANHCNHFDNIYTHITVTRKKTTNKNKVEKTVKKRNLLDLHF